MDSLATPLVAASAGALMLGVSGSFHCLMMCGPLACAGLTSTQGVSRLHQAAAYQAGRIAAYASVGALLGGVGRSVTRTLAVSTQPILPWVIAATLVGSALGIGKRLPAIPALVRLGGTLARWSAKISPAARSAAIGALTPLLPCGLLYGIFAAALASGGAGAGAALMGAFALGGLPMLAAAQAQGQLWKGRPWMAELVMRRVLPLTAAAMLIYRAVEVGAGRSCH